MGVSDLTVEQWTEIAFVEIADNAETPNVVQFGTITDTLDISIGTRDVEAIALLSSGRVAKFTPEDVTEITLELYPIGVTSIGSSPNGILAWYWGQNPGTNAGRNEFGRKYFRVSMLWTNTITDLTSVPLVSAGQETIGDYLRMSFWMSYMTDAKMDFTDDILKQTVTFKCLPFDRAGASRIVFEEYYVDGSTVEYMPVMPAFISGVAPTDPTTWANPTP